MADDAEEALAPAIVRLRANGVVQGAGVLLAPDRVATCAHVVANALGVEAESQRPPDGRALIEFPLVAGSPSVAAEVVDWQPIRADGRGDVAILRLLDPAPPGVLPAPARVTSGGWHNDFQVFGFPNGHDDGVWVTGKLLGKQGTGWRQMRTDPRAPAIQPGFSGAPVWDEVHGCVVGIVVTAATDSETTAYLLPTAELGESWQTGLINPYRGLRSFEEQDARFFHGREDEIHAVLRLLAENRRVVLVGASGSGKSSLVRAGVLPRLREQGVPITSLRPASGEPPHEPPEDGLLFLDQFEEYVSADPAGARELLDRLSASRSRVILTLRPGSLEDLVTTETADWLNRATHLLGPMTDAQLRQAMTGPAHAVGGLAFEAGLVERVLADAPAEAGALPLVSLVLEQLWENRFGGFLTHDAYQRIGGVQGALSRTADAVHRGLAPVEREPAENLLKLLTRQDPKGFVRRALHWSEIPPRLHATARELAAQRLIVIGDGDEPRVELVHQALITHWDRLREWLHADAAFLAWQEELRHGAQRWEDSGEDAGYLLRGEALSTAKDYASERPHGLTPRQRAFIERSDRASRRRARQWRLITALALALALVASVLAFGLYRGNVTLSRRLHAANAQQLVAGIEPAGLRASVQQALAAWREAPDDPVTTGAVLQLRAELRQVRAIVPLPTGARLRQPSTTPDGRTLVARGTDAAGSQRVYLVRNLDRPERSVHVLAAQNPVATAISPDGATVAVADGTNAVTLWSAESGRLLAELGGPKPPALPDPDSADQELRFSGDGRYLSYVPAWEAAAEPGVTTVAWDVPSRAPIAPQVTREDAVVGIFPTRDPETVITERSTSDSQSIVTAYTRGLPRELGIGYVIANGDLVLRCEADGSALVLDPLTGTAFQHLPGASCPHPEEPTGRYISGRSTQLDTVLDRLTGRHFTSSSETLGGGLIAIFESQGGTATEVSLVDGQLFLSDMPRWAPPAEDGLERADTGRELAIAYNDRDELLALDPSLTREFARSAPLVDTRLHSAENARLSRDESRFYLPLEDRLLVYRTRDMRVEQEIPLVPQDSPAPVAELGSGAVAVLNAGRLLLFDPDTGARSAPPVFIDDAGDLSEPGELVDRPGHAGEVLVALAGKLHVVRLPGGRPRSFPLNAEASELIASRSSAVVAAEPGGVRTVDLESGAMSTPMSTGITSDLAYLPPLLITAEGIWDLAARRRVAELPGMGVSTDAQRDGSSMVFHQDGQQAVRIPLDPWRAAADLCRLEDREFTAEELKSLPPGAYRDRPCSVLDDR